MKKIAFLIIALTSLVTLYILSCSKKEDDMTPPKEFAVEKPIELQSRDIDKLILFHYNEYLKNNPNSKGVFDSIWKWLVAHAGVWMFGDCGLNLPCGPCPGICISIRSDGNVFLPVDEDYRLSDQKYEEGMRLIQLALFNDSIMGLTVLHSGLVYNDTIFVKNNFFIGPDASNIFAKDSIFVLKGNYPVSYSHGRNGTTLLNVKTY